MAMLISLLVIIVFLLAIISFRRVVAASAEDFRHHGPLHANGRRPYIQDPRGYQSVSTDWSKYGF